MKFQKFLRFENFPIFGRAVTTGRACDDLAKSGWPAGSAPAWGGEKNRKKSKNSKIPKSAQKWLEVHQNGEKPWRNSEIPKIFAF